MEDIQQAVLNVLVPTTGGDRNQYQSFLTNVVERLFHNALQHVFKNPWWGIIKGEWKNHVNTKIYD